MYSYRAFGLTLRAPFPIPELGQLAPAADIEAADVLVEIADLDWPSSDSGPKPAGILFSAGASELWLRVPGLGHFHVQSGKSIRMDLGRRSDSNYARVVLLSSLLGAILHQREVLGIHANALSADGRRAVLLAGQCGTGKSTFAAELVKQGCRSLSDDLCAVSVAPADRPQAHPFGPFLRLWSDAVARLDVDRDRLKRSRPGLNKWIWHLTERQFQPASLPVAAVIVLMRTADSACRLQRVDGAQAVSAIVSNTYRYHFVEPMRLATAHFSLVARLAAQVPVYRFYYGASLPASRRLAESIYAVLAASGD